MKGRPDGTLLLEEEVDKAKERDYGKEVKHTDTESDCLG